MMMMTMMMMTMFGESEVDALSHDEALRIVQQIFDLVTSSASKRAACWMPRTPIGTPRTKAAKRRAKRTSQRRQRRTAARRSAFGRRRVAGCARATSQAGTCIPQ